MCRVSSLLNPPRVAPYNLSFPHGFEGTSSCDCDCQIKLLPSEEVAFKVRARPETLGLKSPLEENFFEFSIYEEKEAQVLENNLSAEASPSESPKPKKSKKSVRFADDCGQDLEKICYIPSRRAHARKLFTVMLTLDKLNDTVEEKTKLLDVIEEPKIKVRWQDMQDMEEIIKKKEEKENPMWLNKKLEEHNEQIVKSPWKAEFELPVDNNKLLFETLGKKVITLSSFSIKEEPLMMCGTIWTMNLGHDKNVFIRFTTDGWKSYYDRPAKFQEAPDNIYDIFSFEIEIPTNNDKHNETDFCLCYKANGLTFWDSNNGQNYKITRKLKPVQKSQLTKREAFMSRRNGKADAMQRLNEIDWTKFETLKEKTNVKFSIF